MLLLPIITALTATLLPICADARAVAAPRAPDYPGYAKREAYPTPAPIPGRQQHRRGIWVDRDAVELAAAASLRANLTKRAVVANPVPADPVYTPWFMDIVIRNNGRKKVFLDWKPDPSGTFKTAVTKYPRLNFKVAPSNGGTCPSCPSTFPDINTIYDSNVDTGSSAIIIGPNAVGGIGNLLSLDSQHYNGYQYFPKDSGGKLVLGRWTKLQITLLSGDGTAPQKVVATPTVLIATYVADNCKFNGNTYAWPTPGGSRNVGPTSCTDPTYTGAGYRPGDTSPFVEFFGIGWGNFNKQIPVNAQFARTVRHITEANGATTSDVPYSQFAPGYTVGRWGIQFGALNNDKCEYMGLQHSNFNSDDWTRPPACIQLHDTSGNPAGACQRGVVLPDTGAGGLDVRYGSPHPANLPISSSWDFTSGAKISFYLGREDPPSWIPAPGNPGSLAINVYSGSVASSDTWYKYDYSVSSTNADRMPGAWSTYGAYANLGRNFFNTYDMCWDPYNGYVGFRPRETTLPWSGT